MTVTLGGACTHIVDCEHKTSPIDASGEFFAVGTPAMRGNIINYAESRRISQQTFTTWTRRLTPRFGDLLFAREAPVGPVVRIPQSENVAPGQRTVLLRPNPDVVDSAYLYYLLASPLQQSRIASTSSGSTVAHLNVADVRSFELPHLPTLPEQRGIAEVLGALDDKIAVNTRLAEICDQLSSSLFERSAQHSSRMVQLLDICRHVAGKYLSKDKYSAGGKFAVLGSNSVMGTHSEYTQAGAFTALARIGSSCGSLRWSQRPAWVNNNASAIVPTAGTDPWVLRYALKTVDMNPFRGGSGQPFIQIEPLMSALAPWPDADTAARIAPVLRGLSEREQLAFEESARLATTRDALLPLLMSGKVRVKDAEGVVEGVV